MTSPIAIVVSVTVCGTVFSVALDFAFGMDFLLEMTSLSINFRAAFAAVSACIWALVLRIYFFAVAGTGVVNDASNDNPAEWMLLLEIELSVSAPKDFEALLSFSEPKQVELSSELSSELLDIVCRLVLLKILREFECRLLQLTFIDIYIL